MKTLYCIASKGYSSDDDEEDYTDDIEVCFEFEDVRDEALACLNEVSGNGGVAGKGYFACELPLWTKDDIKDKEVFYYEHLSLRASTRMDWWYWPPTISKTNALERKLSSYYYDVYAHDSPYVSVDYSSRLQPSVSYSRRITAEEYYSYTREIGTKNAQEFFDVIMKFLSSKNLEFGRFYRFSVDEVYNN